MKYIERGLNESVSVSDQVDWFQTRGVEGVIEEVKQFPYHVLIFSTVESNYSAINWMKT